MVAMRQAGEGTALATRCASLGNVCLVLGLLEIVYCGQKAIVQLLSGRIVAAERVLLPKAPHAAPAAMYGAAQDFARLVAPWEIARLVPFVLASVVLLFIARRLRAGDVSALGTARQWAVAALGVVALSALIQIVAIIPPTLEYQRRVVELLPPPPHGRAAPPFDIGRIVASATTFGAVMGLAMGTVVLSVWPVGLFVWAGRLRRDAPGHGMIGEP